MIRNFKKIIFLLFAVLFLEIFSSPVLAGGYTEHNYNYSRGQIGLGIIFDEKIGGFSPLLTYVNRYLTMGLGITYQSSKNNGVTVRTVNFISHFGGRALIARNCLFLTYGISGAYGTVNNSDFKDPYIVGPFLGLDYQPIRNLMITAQIMPYSYERKDDNTRENEVFEEGTIGLVYMFS